MVMPGETEIENDLHLQDDFIDFHLSVPKGGGLAKCIMIIHENL
jgi:hypothetical protein